MSLNQDLLDAHARDDRVALVSLYTQAADEQEVAGDTDAACFFLTHAYVFALEMAHPQTATLRHRLIERGREE